MKTAALRTGFLGAAACCAAALFGETVSWTGGAGDGEWTTAGNWDGGAAPAASDVARFAQSAVVAPPADFAGTLYATNATVEIAVAADETRAFTASLDIGASLVKSGEGSLTLRAAPGYRPGGISVKAGRVTFAGRGEFETPGAFGALSVAAGASVEIADSPAADRHGVAVRAVKETVGFDVFKAGVSTAEAFEETWAAMGADERDRWIFRPDGVETFHLQANQTVDASQFYSTNGYYSVLSRALFVMPEEARVTATIYVDDYAQVRCDGKSWGDVQNNKRAYPGSRRLGAGWHVLDVAFHETWGSHYLYLDLTSTAFPTTTKLGPDLLWKGVCFASISLDAGASLAIPDGQAVALACGGASKVAGSVVGGAGSVFAVMGGTLAADAAAFAEFNGSLEATAFGAVTLANAPAEPAFACTGRGTFSAADGLAFETPFAGTMDVPAGTTYTNRTGAAARFTGEGTIVTDVLDGMADFGGTAVLREGASAPMEDLTAFGARTLVMSAGASVSVSGDVAREGLSRPIPGWAEDRDAWNILTGLGYPRDYLNPVGMYVTNGTTLVLTDDTGCQRNSAICTNVTLSASDAWRVRFTFSSKLLGRWPNEVMAEAFSFFLTTSPTTRGTTQGGFPDGSYGFNVYQYRNEGNQGLTWILNGDTGNGPDFRERAMNGISLLKPIDFDVSYRDGVMTVVMTQGEKTFTCRREMSAAFASDTRRYVGFGGGTGWWGGDTGDIVGAGGKSAAVYCYQTIDDFEGSVAGAAVAAEPDVSFTTGDWLLDKDMTLLPGGTNGVETVTWSQKGNQSSDGTNGTAICRTAFSPHQAFWLDVDERLVERVEGWAEGVSIFFRPTATMDGMTDAYYGTGNPSLEFLHYYWANKFFWDENGSHAVRNQCKANNATPQAVGTNHIRIFYNGAGHFTATVSRGTSVTTFEKDYSAILAWDEVHFGFKSATSRWGAYVRTHLLDPVMTTPVADTARLGATLVVDEGAAAEASVGSWSTADVAPFAFAAVEVRDGGTLNVVSAAARPGVRVAMGDVVAKGAAAVAIADGMVAELSTVTAAAASDVLTLSGAWTAPDGRVTFKADLAALAAGGPRTLADFSRAKYAGAGEPEFVCTGLNGEELPARWRVSVKDGVVRLVGGGFLIMIK